MNHPFVRKKIIISGRVQGVGFRPTVYRLALQMDLTGWVKNSPQGVVLEIQGENEAVTRFPQALAHALPPLARITSLEEENKEPDSEEKNFTIQTSTGGTGHDVLISPDVATCPDCTREILDPADRRYGYPFTNCTNCGPRYTITRSIPYDRSQTSMACFPMCPDCLREYEDPLDRRFHAQPNACPVCRPRVWLTDSSGALLCRDREALEACAQRLSLGEIGAVKGLGGFHLACDAMDEISVDRLRRRKKRWGKPLAVMVRDVESVGMLAHVSPEEEKWLTGIERPIVLLKTKDHSLLADSISPDTDRLGIMLPYTPLHHLLLEHLARFVPQDRPPALVMTSGNLSSEPIALGNREAVSRLGSIADFLLLHNRDILVRCDDSVIRVNPESGTPEFFRRARGFTPVPVFLPEKGPSVLGTGPQLKNTLCVTKDDQAFVSQHIGDMENLETLEFFHEIRKHLLDILRTSPELLVADLHPDYLTTRYAREQKDHPFLQLQHHAAHIYAVLAEHRIKQPVLGLALDGTGYGEDGTLWGGECLLVDPSKAYHRRLGCFAPVRLPGGDAAIIEPWRTAQSYLHELGVREPGKITWSWLPEFSQAARLLPQLLEKNINSPVTTSCGRLFDAVCALLGYRHKIAYEGQAAILLEKNQDRSHQGTYACPVRMDGEILILDTLALFSQVYADWCRSVPNPIISRRFHLGLINGIADWASRLAEETNLEMVALSGGVMQNLTMSTELPKILREHGLKPLVHTQVPPNDACISLGQAYFGQRFLLTRTR
ncbi:MAG: carbamoyltransferase HypF [Desulfovibrionales bacterium]